ncbi:hypothetical protein UFOVP1516_64 [uncultured Caudovirales phage]|uniref:Uncharacterized protein n=1 Tax=uncultured Caudovirales phage TaxID=2100421 RepID=A0A6J5PH88_9CAUD|nr:hypothetical protein UFOVP887_71 [uncultured Caudovirales phage]CAB5226935.1 hypothetical protein UFOVP1516_64 [uncultured Caudovirales phage]
MADSALKTALLSLSVENDNHWTKAGLPRVETLKFLTGDSGLTQEIVSAEIPGFNRESATLPQQVNNVVKIEEAKPKEVKPIGLTLSEQLVVEQLKLEQVRKTSFEIEKELVLQSAIVSKLAEDVSNEFGIETSENAIISYLKSQQVVLEERAARQKMIAESGINLKELAQGLRSPLDSSLARKR